MHTISIQKKAPFLKELHFYCVLHSSYTNQYFRPFKCIYEVPYSIRQNIYAMLFQNKQTVQKYNIFKSIIRIAIGT